MNRNALRIGFLVILLLLFARVGYGEQNSKPDTSLRMRREFHRKAEQIKSSMSQNDVLRMLGKPDEIGYSDPVNPSILFWRYGVDSPGGAATLGEVAIAEDGSVWFFTGYLSKRYPLPPEGVLGESELRQIIGIVDRYCRTEISLDCIAFDPLPLIQTVNALLPYGRKKVLVALEEYLWVHRDSDMVQVLLLALFDPPKKEGYLPRLQYARTGNIPTDPANKRLVPRYPLVVIKDVPLFTYFTSTLSGSYITTRRSSILSWFKSHGVWRTHPLTPPTNPFAVLDNFLVSSEFRSLLSEEEPEVAQETSRILTVGVKKQILQMLRRIPSRRDIYDDKTMNTSLKLPDEKWQSIREKVSALHLYWDNRQQTYQPAKNRSTP